MPGSFPERTRVLIYGQDARSDALASACAASSRPHELYAYGPTRNPGLLKKCTDLGLGSLANIDEMVQYARTVRPDYAIVGPEQPLSVGLVDALEAQGIPCFGPYQALAKLETSKSWTRQLSEKYRIPGNPEFRIFTKTDELASYLRFLGEFVIKPDGITGGKGVRVSGEHIASIEDGVRYAEELLASAACFVVEERLEGEEFSLQSICDGEHLLHCPVAQDHKRAFVGDIGPNTGGMGSYSCTNHSLPFLSDGDLEQAKAINTAVARALLEETGRPYRGVLYGGFMATRDGVKLLEYNARFGDPEAMNVLPIFEDDFLSLCEATIRGELDKTMVSFRSSATVCKYVVPSGYPANPVRGKPIVIPPELLDRGDLRVYFAAVNQEGEEVVLTSSRAVAFVGIGETLEEAEALAELGASSVQGTVTHRKDIGTQELVGARINHMAALRGARAG